MKQKNEFPVVIVNDKSFYVINKEDAKEYPKELIELCAPYSDYANKLERDYKNLEETRDVLVSNHDETVESYKSRIETLEQKLNALAEENKEIENTKNAINNEYISICNVVAYNLTFGYFIPYSIFDNPPVIAFIRESCDIISTFSDKAIVCENEGIAEEVIKKLCTGDILFVDAIKKYATNHSDFPKLFETGDKKEANESIIPNSDSDSKVDKTNSLTRYKHYHIIYDKLVDELNRVSITCSSPTNALNALNYLKDNNWKDTVAKFHVNTLRYTVYDRNIYDTAYHRILCCRSGKEAKSEHIKLSLMTFPENEEYFKELGKHIGFTIIPY